MRAIKTLVINSRNRTAGTFGDFTFNFPEHFRFSGIKLVECNIPNTVYNISEDVVLDFNDGLGTIITVLAGNYDIIELCDAIQTALRVFDVNYNCTYNEITMRVAIFNLTPLAFDLPLTGEEELARRLGFAAQDFTGVNLYIGSQAPQLIETEYFITCPNLGNLVDNGIFRSTFVVSLSEIRGNINTFVESNFTQYDNPENRNEGLFSFQLRDNSGEVVNLGADWTMIFRLNETPDGKDLHSI